MGDSSIMVSWIPPNATDNSGVVASLDGTASSNDEFGAGETNVTYTAVDPSGNRASCTFRVVVNGKSKVTLRRGHQGSLGDFAKDER